MIVQSWDPVLAPVSRQTAWNESVQDFRFAGDDSLAFAGAATTPMDVQLHSLEGSRHWQTQQTQQVQFATGGFDPSGRHFIQILPDRCDIYDAATGKRLTSISRKWPSLPSLPFADKSYRWIIGVDANREKPRLRLFDATNLKWTATLLDPGANLQFVQFDDRGMHLIVTAWTAPAAGKGDKAGKGVEFLTTVYRPSDSSKLREIVQPLGNARITDSGYLLSHAFVKNGNVLRAYELKADGRTIESPARSANVSQYWLDSDGKTAAFTWQEGVRQRIALWPFAEAKEAKQLPFDCQSFNAIALFGDRLLLAADVTSSPLVPSDGRLRPGRVEPDLLLRRTDGRSDG